MSFFHGRRTKMAPFNFWIFYLLKKYSLIFYKVRVKISTNYYQIHAFFHRCPVYGHLPSNCRLVIKQNECCGRVSCTQNLGTVITGSRPSKLTNYYQNYFHFFFTVILLSFMDFFHANFRGFCVSLKSQNIMSNKIQISILLWNHELKNPWSKQIYSNQENCHPWIKVLSQYFVDFLKSRRQ